MPKYQLLDPHPQTFKQWEEYNFLPDKININRNQTEALMAIGRGKTKTIVNPLPGGENLTFCVETEEDRDRPIERKVTKIYRTTDGKMYFVQTLKGENFTTGKPVEVTQIVGKHRMAILAKRRHPTTGQWIIDGVRSHQDVYTIPFTTGEFLDESTGEKTSIEKLPKSEKLSFYVISDKKYGITDISLQEFMSRSTQELIYYATHQNQWPPVPEQKARSKAVKDNE